MNGSTADFLYFKPDRRGTPRDDVPRRHSDRLYGPCVAVVRGVDATGRKFSEMTRLNNVSSGGLHIPCSHELVEGSRLFIVFALSTRGLLLPGTPTIAASAEVLRVEGPSPDAKGEVPLPDAKGVAVKFHRQRLLS